MLQAAALDVILEESNDMHVVSYVGLHNPSTNDHRSGHTVAVSGPESKT